MFPININLAFLSHAKTDDDYLVDCFLQVDVDDVEFIKEHQTDFPTDTCPDDKTIYRMARHIFRVEVDNCGDNNGTYEIICPNINYTEMRKAQQEFTVLHNGKKMDEDMYDIDFEPYNCDEGDPLWELLGYECKEDDESDEEEEEESDKEEEEVDEDKYNVIFNNINISRVEFLNKCREAFYDNSYGEPYPTLKIYVKEKTEDVKKWLMEFYEAFEKNNPQWFCGWCDEDEHTFVIDTDEWPYRKMDIPVFEEEEDDEWEEVYGIVPKKSVAYGEGFLIGTLYTTYGGCPETGGYLKTKGGIYKVECKPLEKYKVISKCEGTMEKRDIHNVMEIKVKA